MTEFETLRYEIEDQVLTLTMNRPERLNAFNSRMQGEFLEALEHADADDEVRAVIVTGEGRGFCAGADLGKGADTFNYDNQTEEAKAERASSEGRQEGSNAWLRDGGGLLSLRIYEFNKPIIAAINGPADCSRTVRTRARAASASGPLRGSARRFSNRASCCSSPF